MQASGVASITLHFTISICLIALSDYALATPCNRTDEPELASAVDQQQFEQDGYFIYESRAEQTKDNLLPFSYYWCIENHYPSIFLVDAIDFKWGTNIDPKAFFSGMVAPGKSRPRSITERLEPTASRQPLSYDGSTFLPQTIHPVDVPGGPSSPATAPDISPPPWDSPSHLRGLILELDARLFHAAYGVFDIPSSPEIATAIKENSYRDFSEEDFVAVEFEFVSEVLPEGDEFYFKTGLEYRPHADEEPARVESALKDLKIFLSSEESGFFSEAETDERGRVRLKPVSEKGASLMMMEGIADVISEKRISVDIVDDDDYEFGKLRVNYFAPG